MQTTIKFFPSGETVGYEIRPRVWVLAVIVAREPEMGRYRCRYTPDDTGVEKVGVVDSHNLFDLGDAQGWRSRAEWPAGHVSNQFEGDNSTCDRHDTREQAEGVCALLRREGLGGERIHFPLRTWVEPICD